MNYQLVFPVPVDIDQLLPALRQVNGVTDLNITSATVQAYPAFHSITLHFLLKGDPIHGYLELGILKNSDGGTIGNLNFFPAGLSPKLNTSDFTHRLAAVNISPIWSLDQQNRLFGYIGCHLDVKSIQRALDTIMLNVYELHFLSLAIELFEDEIKEEFDIFFGDSD